MFSYFGWGSSPKPDSNTAPETQTLSTQPQTSSMRTSPPSNTPSVPDSQNQPPPPSQQPPLHTPQTQDKTNLKLLFGGLAFSALSVYITRRASLKKRIACIPPYYSSSIYHQPQVNGAMEAFEALNLATINVFSFGMLTAGMAMYALDVNGVEDMRRIMRGGIEGVAAGKSDEELESEVTEWVAGVLGERFEKQLEKEKAKKRDGKGDGSGEDGKGKGN